MVESECRPVLRYVGSKFRLYKHFKHLLPTPDSFDVLYEPFAGGLGFTLAFLLDSNYSNKKARVNDVNPLVRIIYEHIRDSLPEFLSAVKRMKRPTDKAEHCKEWDTFNRSLQRDCNGVTAANAARYVYMVNLSYGSKVLRRANGDLFGSFVNNPTIAHPVSIQVTNALHEFLNANKKRITWATGDYQKHVRGAKRGSFVFMDPPYLVPANSQTRRNQSYYDGTSFDLDQLEELVQCMDQLTKRDVLVLITLNNIAEVRNAFKAYSQTTLSRRQSLSHAADELSQSNELIIRNYE